MKHMDLTQLSQMVAWLDEEHRRDREELAKLDQRLQSMTVENQEQARRIQDLEGRLASTQAQLARFTQLEQALQQLKNEVVVMLDKQTEARLQAEREAERARLSDREALGRSVAEIRKEIPRLARIEEELVTRQAEDQRLGEMLLALRQSVNNVSKDLDERTRTLPYMVEQRAQDNKRIAQLQAENVELLKRTDAAANRCRCWRSGCSVWRRSCNASSRSPISCARTSRPSSRRRSWPTSSARARWASGSRISSQQRELIEKQVVRMREFTAQYDAAGRAIKTLEEFQAQIMPGRSKWPSCSGWPRNASARSWPSGRPRTSSAGRRKRCAGITACRSSRRSTRN